MSAVGCLAFFLFSADAQAAQRFEISFPTAVHAGSITGRAYVVITKTDTPEPRLVAGSWGDSGPLFGVDVNKLAADETAVIDESTFGAPVHSLRDIPAGDYFVQAILNIYTEFHRADGHRVWLHMDQWEGQHFNRSPGNLYSEVQKVHLDPAAGYKIKLSLTRAIPPIEVPPDTPWVKHIKIQSEMLTRFWGHPMYIGAIVLLPKGYDEHPNARYPAIYEQNHFSLQPPFGFSTEDRSIPPELRTTLTNLNRETGYEFYQAWNSENFPRMIAVTFQHPTQYYDDSYAVNSVNNGPYGDALVKEMIPYLEAHFR
ncbi:MAG: hypothetical protein DMG42_11830, partial [Acidobacteria bacterium]